MSDFQNDLQNRSEILQSPINLTDRQSHNQNTNYDLNNNETFSLASLKEGQHSSSEININNHLVESDTNFNNSNVRNTNRDETKMLTESQQTIEENTQEEEVHVCKIVVTILAAFPADVDKDNSAEAFKQARITEGPKAQNFYKFEYQLDPEDPETIVTADLVTYRIAAKLYPEKGEPRVLKSWENDGKIWVTWNQVHELKMTRNRLLKLFDHEIVLKIWDSRDLCSLRTKIDKPKPFKFPKIGENTEDAVKISVLSQCEQYLKQIPKELQEKLERRLPNQSKIYPADFFQELSEKMTNTIVATSLSVQSVGNRLKDLAEDFELTKNVKIQKNKENLTKRNKSASKLSKRSSQMSLTKNRSFIKPKEKTKKEIAAEQDFIRKNGNTRVKLKMKILFAGDSFLITRLEETLPTIEDCFLNLTLENSLMSEQQLYDLNPITIKIEKTSNMPDKPIGFVALKEKCEKVYCKYNFFQQPLYKTCEIVQDKHLYFNDTNVYLAGLLNKEELHEFLHYTPFEIEIHDRDRKQIVDHPLRPCLFGNDAADNQISSVNSVASKHTIHNPFETRLKQWDPYGVAKLNLYELVLGKKLVEFFIPILPCAAPDVLGRSSMNKSGSTNTKVLGFDDLPLHSGSFLDSNTHINVKVTVAKPLFHSSHRNRSQNSQCVFSRLVIRIDSNKYHIVKSIIENVRKINASGLELSEHPIPVQEAALSTYKLSEEEQASKTLNIITGFHLIDSKTHVFVLEGLKDSGVKIIYEEVPRTRNETGIDVIYNSSLGFSKRLYASLDVELLKIKLFEPLDEIVKKPLLYIRDMTPKTSFDALTKLQLLLSEYRLRNIVRCDLLPTSAMITSMSREFGVPLTDAELQQLKQSEKIKLSNIENNFESEASDVYGYGYGNTEVANIPHTSRIWTPIDNFNEQFLMSKKEVHVKNYISHNIETLQELHDKNIHKKPLKHYLIADEPTFKYSSQTMNSTEIALNRFRDYINENTPNTLYTYNPEYHHSMTFVPVNIKKEEKVKAEESISKWRSAEGWVYPDVKTTMQCNEHPQKPDPASLDKLNEPWDENMLHANMMKSPLDRTFYRHSMRHNDFNVWSKPTPEETFKSLNLPMSIFEPGIIKEHIERRALLSEREKWKEKVVVETLLPKTHKISAATELKESGFASSNQIDKLKGLLKNEPKKLGFLAGGRNFDNIPALSVIKTEYEDEFMKFANGKGYTAGSLSNIRITDDKNRIPVHFYNKVHFEKTKGGDFNFSGPARSSIYKKRLQPILNASVDENTIINQESKTYIIPNQNDLNHVENFARKNVVI